MYDIMEDLNDELFREKTKERARQYYHIKKSKINQNDPSI
jgi:hypothetical protein